jgi:hypothetical protein
MAGNSAPASLAAGTETSVDDVSRIRRLFITGSGKEGS